MPDAETPDAGVAPEEVIALLARPPEEFVAARTARAKELRSEGRRDEAAALAKVRKPVRLVWVVGELARRHPDVAEEASGVAEEVEEAMAGGGGVRPLLARFREVVGEVAGLADDLDGSIDRLQVGLALREVLADPDARAEWLEGRLLTLPGDEPVVAPPDELAPRRAARQQGGGRANGAKATRKAPSGSDDDAAARAAAEQEAEEARQSAAEARRLADAAVADAAAEVEAARAAQEEAAASLEDLEERLAALEAEVAAARSEVGDAGGVLDDAEARLATAEQARAVLDDGDGGPPRRRRK